MASRQRERRRCLEILGVQEDATDDDIRKSYRRMALIFHPDKNESDDAKEKFQEIGYAYKYLTEGPSAVGFEEDGHFSGHAGGHDMPIDILMRLFPWMMNDFGLSRPSPSPFGGLFGHHFSSPFHQSPFDHFFMDPFSSMHGYDDDDDDDGEEIVFIQNGRITVMKTGNSRGNYGRRRNRHAQRRCNNDSYQPRSSPFHSRQNQHSSHGHQSSNSYHPRQSQHSSHGHQSSNSYHPTNENARSSQNKHSSENFYSSSSTADESYPKKSTENNTGRSSGKPSDNSSTDYYDNNYSSTPVSQNSTASNKTAYKSKTDTTGFSCNTEGNKSANKNKPQTVITSRKERKKMKKVNKAGNQPKPTTTEEKTTPPSQEETTEPVDNISDDDTNSTSIDDLDDFGSTQVPLKLNKKQRRKLKRESERLEKEMAQNSSSGKRLSPDFLSSAREDAQEVEDDGEESTTSSAANDTDFSVTDTKSRRAKKNEKRKQRTDFEFAPNTHSPEYEELLPRSKYDEEEMLRIALEMSKKDVHPNSKEECSASHSNEDKKPKSKHEKLLNGQGRNSSSQGQGTGNNSWYDDIGTSPFHNPMEDMKKTYYKDMSSSLFDPGSYYRSDQRSTGSHSQANKENYAKESYKQRQGADSKPKSQGTRYFYSKNYKPPDEVDGKSHFSHIDSHHQKYFKSAPHKHSFDLDEPDDVPLNVSDSKSGEAQNGGYHMGEVLNSSLNVPKGIHVHHANHVYGKK